VEKEHSEEKTQTLENINISRYLPLQDGYMESYWVMDKEKAISLESCIGNEILCTGEDKSVRWIQPGGELKDTPYKIGDETEAGAGNEAVPEQGDRSQVEDMCSLQKGERKEIPDL